MSKKHPRPTLPAKQLAVAWQSASLLLGYPEEELLGELEMIRAASHELPPAIGEPIRDVVVHLESRPLTESQAEYVETFDNRRRNSLFLTYFAHGDTRKRGVALLRFKQTYLRSGFVLDADSEHGGELRLDPGEEGGVRAAAVAEEVARLEVPDPVPIRAAIALQVIDGIRSGFALEEPVTRHKESLGLWRG